VFTAARSFSSVVFSSFAQYLTSQVSLRLVLARPSSSNHLPLIGNTFALIPMARFL